MSIGISTSAGSTLPLFSMNRAMLDATNAQNLADVLRDVPFYNRYIDRNEVVGYAGVVGLQFTAIYKNGFPLLMDQNTSYDIRSIPIWDIDSLAIFLSDINLWSKNNNGLVLHLYSKDYVDGPNRLILGVTPTSLGDLHTYIQTGFSNAKHSISAGANRSFESQMVNEQGRFTPWASNERYDANLRYKYYILPTVSLDVTFDNTWQTRLLKSDIIPQTTRVKDIEQNFRKNNFFGSLTTALSKNHSLVLNGQYHLQQSSQLAIDKDLSSNKQDVGNVTDYLDELGYQQGLMQLVLEADFKNFGYKAGIELSSTADRVFPTINAISSSYSDYGVFGLFNYQYKKLASLNGGAKLLTNSLTGAYFLPQATITFAPEDLLQVRVSYIRSIAYPSFQQIFYTEQITNALPNNLLLEPVLLNSFHSQLNVQKNAIEMQTGLMFTQQNNLISEYTTGYRNNNRSAGTFMYFNFNYKKGENYISPNVVLHGLSPNRDSLSRVFFYPEFNLYGNWHIESLKTNVLLAGRYLGKYSHLLQLNQANVLTETGESVMIDLAIRRVFLKNKLSVVCGVNNIMDTRFIAQNTYVLGQFDRQLLSESEVLKERGRYVFVKLGYQFK